MAVAQENGFQKIIQRFGSLFKSTEVKNGLVNITTNADMYMFDKPVIGPTQGAVLTQNEFATGEWVKNHGGIQKISINGKETYRSGGENMIFVNPGPGIGVSVSDQGTLTISNTGGSGGESVQANMQVSDPADPAFIENRIAYYTEGQTFHQIGSAGGSLTTEGDYKFVRDTTGVSSIIFEAGMSYQIEDSNSSGFTTFTGTAKRVPAVTTITQTTVQAYSIGVGNLALADSSLDDTGEPVLVIKDGLTGDVVIITQGETSYQGIIVYGKGKSVGKTLDDDLIPSGIARTANLATVATTGSYNDLSDQPTIPSLSGYATETYVTNAVDAAKGLVYASTSDSSFNQQPGTFLAATGTSTIYLQLGAASGDNTYEFSGVIYGVTSVTFNKPFGHTGNILWPEGTVLTGLDSTAVYGYSIIIRYNVIAIGHFQKYVALS